MTKPIDEKDVAEFYRLFWIARKSHLRLKGASAADAAHQAAIAWVQERQWKWAESLLDASRFDGSGEPDRALKILGQCEVVVPEGLKGLVHFIRGGAFYVRKAYDQAIKEFRQVLADPKFEAPGVAWMNLGNALSGKMEYDEAIKAYRQALADPKPETPGKVWSNLGNAFNGKKEYDEAIKAFRQALADPKYDTPGIAWYNLGNAFKGKKAYDEAIKAFRQALADPKYNTPGYAWNNLGNAFNEKKEYDEAIKAYRQALADPKYDTPAKAWTNLAQTCAETKRLKEAGDAYKKALEFPDQDGSDHARARLGLQLLQSEIKTEALSADDRAMAAAAGSAGAGSKTDSAIENEIIAAIKEAGATQYDKYAEKEGSKRENTLSILRGWSSAVTLLEGSERRWRGGGYFLKWRGFGVVIDPGFDFLRNFHDAGYHGREIQAVIVSHNHPDHNSDLKDIDDLQYELFKRRGEKRVEPYVLIWDQDTDKATKFGFVKPEHQHEPIVIGTGLLQPYDLLRDHPATVPLRVKPFKARHGDDVPHAMGMVLELLDEKGMTAVRIGYTGDTAYFDGLHTQLMNCDILIAHVSQPSVEELKDSSKFKEVHLGYRGTSRLLKECKPKLALIGEFWAGFTDLRILLVKALRQQSGVEMVLPAGLGMHVRLPSLEIECTQCGKPIEISKVKVAPATDQFGNLAYICPGCLLG